ncbi:unnamed protein product [Trifolium pratense]|uniref:Uncharacterized protein n=1 Tax=Trifolium pratense TaxID=57577 RepID=A0ACB0IK72_TRIPR|nr:unnamed protein product [Trifolium pratense]
MATSSNNGFPAHLPIFDGKNYDQWIAKMKVIFRLQDVVEIVNDGVAALPRNTNDEQNAVHKESKKKDGEALFIIHQCLDADIFEKILHCESAKEAWDTLARNYGGDEKLKKARLQSLRRQYELLQMNESETVSQYFVRLTSLTNQMVRNGETITDLMKIEKVLRTLTPKFDHIVVAKEESKNLEELKFEELQASLEAHELRLTERSKNNAECKSKKVPREKTDEAKFVYDKQEEDPESSMLMAVIKEEEDDDKWYLDIGCSNHMSGKRTWFYELDETVNRRIRFADDSSVRAEGIGKIKIRSKDGKDALISDVLYVPTMKSNLISIGQLLEKNYVVKMEDKVLRVFDSKTDFESSNDKAKDIQNWRKNMVNGLPQIKVSDQVCDKCCISKQSRNSYNTEMPSRATRRLEAIHSDVCGPFEEKSMGGNSYFVSFIDEFTRKLWIYMIAKKSEVFDVFKKFRIIVQNESGEVISKIRTDGGGEYTSNEFKSFCASNGIKHEITAPYTPQHNGTAERKNRTIVNMVRSMIKEKGLPHYLWGEATSTAAWSGIKPCVKHLRVFGSLCYRHIPDQLRKKLDDKAHVVIMVGYLSTGSYKLYDPIGKRVMFSKDVKFDESKSWNWEGGISRRNNIVYLNKLGSFED